MGLTFIAAGVSVPDALSGIAVCKEGHGRPWGQRNYKDTNPQLPSLLVFNRVYRLEIQSVMLVFSNPLVNCCPSRFRTYKIATPHQTKAPVKTTFRD
jgi:hypothetical protein